MSTTTFNESDHPRGTGGQFATKKHAEADIDLSGPAGRDHLRWLEEYPDGGRIALYSGAWTQGRVLTRDEVIAQAAGEGLPISEDGFDHARAELGLLVHEESLLNDASEDESDPAYDVIQYGSIDPRHWDSVLNGGFSAPTWELDAGSGTSALTATQHADYGPEDIGIDAGAVCGRPGVPWADAEALDEDVEAFLAERYGLTRVDGTEDSLWELSTSLPAYPTQTRAAQAWQDAYAGLDRATTEGTMPIAFDEWATAHYGRPASWRR